MVSADMSQQQLAVRARVVALLTWERLTSVMATSMEIQTLLLDAVEKNKNRATDCFSNLSVFPQINQITHQY